MKVEKHAVVLGVAKGGKRFVLGVGEPAKMRALYKTTDGKKEKDSATVVFYFDSKGNNAKRTLRKPNQGGNQQQAANPGGKQQQTPNQGQGQGGNNQQQPQPNQGQGQGGGGNNGGNA